MKRKSKKWAKRPLKIRKSDGVKTEESLTNNKKWFNGVHSFSSVKINPARKKDDNVLEINVSDGISASGGLV